jgi:hypothetical protein
MKYTLCPLHLNPTCPTGEHEGRRRLFQLGLLMFSLAATGCDGRPSHGTFEVVLYSYLDRPIFDVMLSGFDIGVAGAWAGDFAGGGSMSGLSVKFGAHKVSWRLGGPEGMPRNGETVRAINEPVLKPPPHTHRFLCVHVYPDQTAELITSAHFPDKTERGIAMGEALRRSHAR